MLLHFFATVWPHISHPLLSFLPLPSSLPLQGDRMDREAMKCQVLTVSNHSCESLTLVGNTLECTVPTELQAATSKELQVEVRHTRLMGCLSRTTHF